MGRGCRVPYPPPPPPPPPLLKSVIGNCQLGPCCFGGSFVLSYSFWNRNHSTKLSTTAEREREMVGSYNRYHVISAMMKWMGPSSPHFSPQCPLLCSGREREKEVENQRRRKKSSFQLLQNQISINLTGDLVFDAHFWTGLIMCPPGGSVSVLSPFSFKILQVRIF